MSEFNSVERIIQPESPKLIPNEVIHIYVPMASYNDKGVASYNIGHFIVQNGNVSISSNILNDIINSKNIIGIGSLNSENKTLILAINELLSKINLNSTNITQVNNRIGLGNLNTESKILIDAINELLALSKKTTDDFGVAINDINSNVETLENKIDVNESDIDDLGELFVVLDGDLKRVQNILGDNTLNLPVDSVTDGINELDSRVRQMTFEIAGLSNLHAGIARTFVIDTFYDFIQFLNGNYQLDYTSASGDTVFITIEDVVTGDNLLIVEQDVADFWFEKTNETSDELYDYHGETYSLIAQVGDTILGKFHVLETDYSVIEGLEMSASVSKRDAEIAAKRALAYQKEAQTASEEAKSDALAAADSEFRASNYASEAQKNAEESSRRTEESRKYWNDMVEKYDDLDSALDVIIAIQNELIQNGATPPTVYTISGRWQFNEKAKAELGVEATHLLDKTNVNFTSGGIEFMAIDCMKSSCNYWRADDEIALPIHESGHFDCYGLGDDVLDFGDEPQVVTEEFLAWVDYYMI